MVPQKGQTREYDSRHKEKYLASVSKSKRGAVAANNNNNTNNNNDAADGDDGEEEYEEYNDDVNTDDSAPNDDTGLLSALLDPVSASASDYQDQNFQQGHHYHHHHHQPLVDEGEDIKSCYSEHLGAFPYTEVQYDIGHPHGDGALVPVSVPPLPTSLPISAVPLGARFPSNYNMSTRPAPELPEVKVEELTYPESHNSFFALSEDDYASLVNM